MSNPTYDDVSRALRNLAARSSPAEANRILAAAAGTTSLREIPQENYGDVVEALDGATVTPREEEMLDEDGEIDSTRVYAKWNASGKRAAD